MALRRSVLAGLLAASACINWEEALARYHDAGGTAGGGTAGGGTAGGGTAGGGTAGGGTAGGGTAGGGTAGGSTAGGSTAGGGATGGGTAGGTAGGQPDYEWALWPIPAIDPTGFASLDGGSIIDSVTGLEWERVGSMTLLTWDQARLRCESSGWRLPTLIELESIVDYATAGRPSLHPAFSASMDYYWSSSPAVPPPSGWAWAVDFWVNPGRVDKVAATNQYYSRCVR